MNRTELLDNLQKVYDENFSDAGFECFVSPVHQSLSFISYRDTYTYMQFTYEELREIHAKGRDLKLILRVRLIDALESDKIKIDEQIKLVRNA